MAAKKKPVLDPLDAALAKEMKKRKKNATHAQARNFKPHPNANTNTAEPANGIIKLLGGVRPVARYLGCSPGTVSRWATPKSASANGGDGAIPAERHSDLIEMAKSLRKRLSKAAFLL